MRNFGLHALLRNYSETVLSVTILSNLRLIKQCPQLRLQILATSPAHNHPIDHIVGNSVGSRRLLHRQNYPLPPLETIASIVEFCQLNSRTRLFGG